MSLILTIRRRYCTGASEIAEKIAEKYNLPIYGKDYICKRIHNQEDLE